MAAQKETFKEHEIVIDDNDQLTINGQPITVTKEDGSYYTPYLPYAKYEDLMTLAKKVVDKAPDFDTISKNRK